MNPPSVDGLVYCGTHAEGWSYGIEDIRRDEARAQVDQAVLVAPRPPHRSYGPENSRIAEIVEREPGRFFGLVRINPLDGAEARDDLERFLAARAMHGLFLHPGEELFRLADDSVSALVQVAAMRHAPVVVATGFPWRSEALQVAALASRYPEIPFVMTNGGQFNISGLGMRDAWAALQSAPNLRIHTAGEYRQDFIEDVVTRLSAQRVLFASGAPQFEPAFEVLRIRWAQLPDTAIHAMLGGNWLELLA
jgi:predicted TIM-barrel fold metal-dependent hydrolase